MSREDELDPTKRWQVRPLAPEDQGRWRELYTAYARFYAAVQTGEQTDLVWGWLMDPRHEVEGLVVHDAAGTVVGLAHVRAFSRPLSATVGGFLDDLFVEPEARGTGAADALLAALRSRARERGWSVVRWITSADNHRARVKYDQVAAATTWVTYDMRPDGS